MFTWLSNNLGNIFVIMILAGIVCSILFSMKKNHAKGQSACGCGCSSCAMSGSCHGGCK